MQIQDECFDCRKLLDSDKEPIVSILVYHKDKEAHAQQLCMQCSKKPFDHSWVMSEDDGSDLIWAPAAPTFLSSEWNAIAFAVQSSLTQYRKDLQEATNPEDIIFLKNGINNFEAIQKKLSTYDEVDKLALT